MSAFRGQDRKILSDTVSKKASFWEVLSWEEGKVLKSKRLQELWELTEKACSDVSVQENATRVNYSDWKVHKHTLSEGGKTMLDGKII